MLGLREAVFHILNSGTVHTEQGSTKGKDGGSKGWHKVGMGQSGRKA